jgi:hypothetical protein
MSRNSLLLSCLACLALAGPAFAEDPKGDKLLSGMSIVGNDEAPKSLVIVPWKSSELGARPDVSNSLVDGRRPVDRAVFMRQLDYYEIRSRSTAAPGSPKR